ncbi:MAG: hypothetical protein JWR21_911 [Herminiimonas sp.]|nr:hypothetical protein [Herminiimonas sp.]
MTRQKFTTRTITLVSAVQIDTALAVIPNLPIDAKRPLELVIREQVKVRGLDANGYYWLRLGEIAEQAWFHGRQFSKEVWHEYCRQNLMPESITTKDGEVRSKWLESPDGSPVVISTTLLERGCFAEYTTAVEAFGGSLGVMFSANPNEARRAA